MAQPLIVPTAPKLESQKDSEEVRKSLLDLASKINEAILGTGREISNEALTADQKAALAGTDGTPSGTNPYVTDSDPRLSGSSPYLPTADEKAALAGSYGTPSATNKYLTEADPNSLLIAGTAQTLYSDASTGTGSTTTPTVVKQFTTSRRGVVTINCTHTGGSGTTAYLRLDVNSTAIVTWSIQNSSASRSANITIKPGDVIKFYAWVTLMGLTRTSAISNLTETCGVAY